VFRYSKEANYDKVVYAPVDYMDT